MKKLIGLGATVLAVPAAIASAVLIHPAVAVAQPVSNNAINVVGEPYFRAVSILKSQGVKQRFDGSVTGPGGAPQAQCIVDQQRATSQGVMLLHLDCTAKAVAGAVDSSPAPAGAGGAGGAAPGAPAPGAGQGTYGGPIGVPVPVG